MTSPPTASPGRFPAGSAAFPHRHLLGIAGLQPWEIEFILAEAEQWVALNRSGAAKRDDRLRLYGGQLALCESPLGGLRAALTLPLSP